MMGSGQDHDKRQKLAPDRNNFGRKRMKTFKGMLFYASAIALGSQMAAHAQEDDSERKLGTVTVTGSLIQ
jgi:hypothetical protein